jgi:Protein of unknown function (DUF1572)
MKMDLAAHYLEEAARQLRGHKRMAEGAISQVNDDEFFRAIDPEANSIAVIVKHISGNQRSRFTDFLTSDGEKPDRHRDTEFVIDAKTTRADVMNWWEQGWKILLDTLGSLKPEDVTRTVLIRNEPHTVLQAINRQIAHYAQHIGQIVFLAKHLKSSEWKTLSIPRGKSEEFNNGGVKLDYSKGVLTESK